MGENWIEHSWSGMTLEEKLAWLTNNLYWLKINMDVNDSKFIKMYNELKSNFEDFSLYVNNNINDIKTDVNDIKTDVNDIKTDVNDIKTDVNNIKTDVNDKKMKMVTYLDRDISNNIEKIDPPTEDENDYIVSIYYKSSKYFDGFLPSQSIIISGEEKYYEIDYDFKFKEDKSSDVSDDFRLKLFIQPVIIDGQWTIIPASYKLNKDTNAWERHSLDEIKLNINILVLNIRNEVI